MNAYGKIRAIQKLRDMGIPVPGDATGREVADIINMINDRPKDEDWESAGVIMERFLADGRKPELPTMQPLKPKVFPPNVLERMEEFARIPSLYK